MYMVANNKAFHELSLQQPDLIHNNIANKRSDSASKEVEGRGVHRGSGCCNNLIVKFKTCGFPWPLHTIGWCATNNSQCKVFPQSRACSSTHCMLRVSLATLLSLSTPSVFIYLKTLSSGEAVKGCSS